MTAKEPKLEDAGEALAAAIGAALAAPPQHRLIEVMIGPYSAAGEGWWFTLQFLAEVSNRSSSQEEAGSARISKIVHAWSKAMGVHPGGDDQESEQRAPEAPRTGGSPS